MKKPDKTYPFGLPLFRQALLLLLLVPIAGNKKYRLRDLDFLVISSYYRYSIFK